MESVTNKITDTLNIHRRTNEGGMVITNNGANIGENVSNSHNLTFHPDNMIQGKKFTKPLSGRLL